MEPTPSSKQIAAAEQEFCEAFRRDYPIFWLATLLVPPLTAVAICTFVRLLSSVDPKVLLQISSFTK